MSLDNYANVESQINEEIAQTPPVTASYGSIFVFGTAPQGECNVPTKFDPSTVQDLMGSVPLDTDSFATSVVRGAYEIYKSKTNKDTAIFMVRVGSASAPKISLYENDRFTTGALSYTLDSDGVLSESFRIKGLIQGLTLEGADVVVTGDSDSSSETYLCPTHIRITLPDGSTASWNLSVNTSLPGVVTKVSKLVSLINAVPAFQNKIRAEYTPLEKTVSLTIAGTSAAKTKLYDIEDTGLNRSWGDKLVSVASAYYEKEVSFEIASGESVAELPVEVEKNLEGGSSITDFIYESSDETALVINAQNEGDTSAVVSLLCSGTTGWDPAYSIKGNATHGWDLTVQKIPNGSTAVTVPEYTTYTRAATAGAGGAAVVTMASVANLANGMPVTGTRIPSNTTVSSVNSVSKEVTLSNNITEAAYTETVTFSKSVSVSDVARTTTSDTITVPSASTTLWAGMVVTGTGIPTTPSSTVILEISGTTVRLSALPTSESSTALTFTGTRSETCSLTGHSTTFTVAAGSFYGTGTVTAASAHITSGTSVTVSSNTVTLGTAVSDTSLTGDLVFRAVNPNWSVNTTTGALTINNASGFSIGDQYLASYRFRVVYTEAKTRSEILDGDPRVYFVYGDQIIFGSTQPTNVHAYYTPKVYLSKGQIVIENPDKSLIRLNVTDSDLPAVGSALQLNLLFEPELPAPSGKTLVGSIVQPSAMSGGSDGKITDKIAYGKAVKAAMKSVSMYPRRRNVVMDLWLDDAVKRPDYETGINVLQPLNLGSELIPYIDTLSKNVEESSLLIPVKPPTDMTNAGINEWIDRLITNDTSDLTRPANIIDGYASFRADAPVGVLTVNIAEIASGKAYFANPACIYAGFYEDLPLNRAAVNRELPSSVVDLGVKVMDMEVINSLNEKRYTTAIMKPDGRFVWADAPTLASRRSNYARQFVREAVYELLYRLRSAADRYIGQPMLDIYMIPLNKDLGVAGNTMCGKEGIFVYVKPSIVAVAGGRITGTTKVIVNAQTAVEIRKIKFETNLSLGE